MRKELRTIRVGTCDEVVSHATAKGKYAFNGTGYTEGGMRNKRCVWDVPTKPYGGAHFAVFPPELIETCIDAGCPPDGIVFDPFMGSGTTAYVARQQGKNYIGSELNPEYIELANERLSQGVLID